MRITRKLAPLLAVVMLFTACPKNQTPEQAKDEFVAYAKDINSAFITAGPLIAQLKPELKPTWDRGTATAGRLLVAVEASDETTASRLLVELIPTFTEIANEFTGNTKVLVVLALADIGLRFLANHYKSAGASGHGAAAGNARVKAFANRPAWRCRNSQSGRYAKMTWCASHPDVSTVETQ